MTTPYKCIQNHKVKQFFYGPITLYTWDPKQKLYVATTERSLHLCFDNCPNKCMAKTELGMCVFTSNDDNVQHEH